DDRFFFQAEDGIRDDLVTGVQTCALPILSNQTPQAAAPPFARGALEASRDYAFPSGSHAWRPTSLGSERQEALYNAPLPADETNNRFTGLALLSLLTSLAPDR